MRKLVVMFLGWITGWWRACDAMAPGVRWMVRVIIPGGGIGRL